MTNLTLDKKMLQEEPLNKLLPYFVQNLENKGRSPSTVLAYRADIEQLVDFLGQLKKMMPTEVEPQNIEAFRDGLLEKNYTPKSVSRKLNAVKTFFRWLVENGVLKNDPSKNVSHPRVDTSTPKFLSQLEYRALRDVVRTDKRIYAIVELIIQTGMRISEVAAIKTENIKAGELTIEEHATQPKRTIPLNKVANSALQEYLEKRPESDSPYIFISKNGNSLAVRNIRAAIDRYMQKAGIPDYSVNDLRTTFIVENLKKDVDLVLISKVVGHKRLSTTERYLELAQIKEPGKKLQLEEL